MCASRPWCWHPPYSLPRLSLLDLKAIDEAEHFIYIENQFFITSLAGGGVENTIGEALYAST
jgi:phosphatidylserine/phosphatidylglycerophosphate/cardiolipin synthase-like enzyme